METLKRLVAERGAPENLRADNGPELTARAVREWCEDTSIVTAYIDPGSPWQNAWVESFNARLRDEVLDIEEFSTLAEAQFLAAAWLEGYDADHHRSALGNGAEPFRCQLAAKRTSHPINQPRTLTAGDR